MEDYKQYVLFAEEIAKKAGKIMKKYLEQDNGATYKQDNTIVTLADTEMNQLLIDSVKEQFPEHAVEGEEASFGKSDFVWVCDPIDGTAMYARQIQVSVFSLALVINGIPKVGVVYDPFGDNIYTALAGEGAYKNGKRILVNDIALTDKRSVAYIDMWPEAQYDASKLISKLSKESYIVNIGSIIRASVSIAEGGLNIAFFPGTKGKHFDIAAIKVIVEEAGGKVTNIFGQDQKYDTDINGAIISNGVDHKKMIKICKELYA